VIGHGRCGRRADLLIHSNRRTRILSADADFGNSSHAAEASDHGRILFATARPRRPAHHMRTYLSICKCVADLTDFVIVEVGRKQSRVRRPGVGRQDSRGQLAAPTHRISRAASGSDLLLPEKASCKASLAVPCHARFAACSPDDGQPRNRQCHGAHRVVDNELNGRRATLIGTRVSSLWSARKLGDGLPRQACLTIWLIQHALDRRN
jgi:hypothetical protein